MHACVTALVNRMLNVAFHRVCCKVPALYAHSPAHGLSSTVSRDATAKLPSMLRQCSAHAPAETLATLPVRAAGGHASQAHSAFAPPQGPGNYSAGATRSFGDRGTAEYWPRMPCLRCGCPWWLGDDWDARCVRCDWSCESDGYDDDSKPLRTGNWEAKYDRFRKYIKRGMTAPWPPRPDEFDR
eukprot:TRINITY_DN11701_c0_g1_i1.p1 TRINITY_DN11701_c0_g1~~TRINITY_DN11701_c0_g1_i1.p1  ORF type:complete len:184 (-),score=10.97 TRINITY_DN11701_c0_g1_i1:164-715(-)